MLDEYGETFKISYAAHQPTVVILVPHINIDTQKVMSTFGLLAGCKEVVSNSRGLVDFSIGLVIFVLNLRDGQMLFFGEIQNTEGL